MTVRCSPGYNTPSDFISASDHVCSCRTSRCVTSVGGGLKLNKLLCESARSYLVVLHQQLVYKHFTLPLPKGVGRNLSRRGLQAIFQIPEEGGGSTPIFGQNERIFGPRVHGPPLPMPAYAYAVTVSLVFVPGDQ